MVKTTINKSKGRSSKPADGEIKFSRSVLLKTEKIIKFAKMLQDFIILQQREILDYCIKEPETQEQDTKQPLKLPEPFIIPEVSNKRKVGRPRKAGVNSETNELKNIKKERVPMMIRAGTTKEGKPLYKVAPREYPTYYTEERPVSPNRGSPLSRGFTQEADGFSQHSIPDDMIKALDNYIINDKSLEEEDNDNDEEYVE